MSIDRIGSGGEGGKEREPYVNQERVAMYQLAAEKLSCKPSRIYHPSSGEDTSPSAAFPDAHVIYVDPDDAAMAALKKVGFDAHAADADSFDPGEVDVVILQNAYAKTEEAVSHLRPGGLAMVNDYLGTAGELRRNPDFELVGVVNRLGGLAFDTESLDDYWKEVETEEEFKRLPMYEVYKGDVERSLSDLTPEGKMEIDAVEGVFEKHKVLQKLIREKKIVGEWSEVDGNFMQARGGRFVWGGFPTKKGSVDDLYVFRKK